MSLKLLRETIRRLILEVKPLDAEDQKELEKRNITPDKDSSSNARDQRRVFGLQSKEEQISDRNILKMYHKELHSTPEGRELIKQFQTGNGVTVWHSIGYESLASKAGEKLRRGISGRSQRGNNTDGYLMKWFRQFGKQKSKNQVSACATSSNIGQRIPNDVWGADNGIVIVHGIGFIIRGYPAFVSVYDQMTQTLGSIPQSLVQHQKNSGIAKRPGDFDGLIIEPNFGFAGEVAMDNWTVHGVYMNFGAMDAEGDLGRHGATIKNFMDVFWDALHTSLPVYIYNGTELFGTYQGLNEKYLDEVYGPLSQYYRDSKKGKTKSADVAKLIDSGGIEFDKTLVTPKTYTDKYSKASNKEQKSSKEGGGPLRPADKMSNPWYLYAIQKKAIEMGEREPDPANDWADPANPDLPCTVDPSFESWGDLYDAYFPGWRNWK